MIEYSKYRELSPTAYAEALNRCQFMDLGMNELWPQIPRIAGPAFTVQLHPSDNLMLHAAIYVAPAGSIIVVDAGNTDFAVAGGNVCAVAQKRGVAGFVIDGVIRDLAEIRQNKFPVFARGVIPIPGQKNIAGPLNTPINCGGVNVSPGDIIVADEEGIAVIPAGREDEVYGKAKTRAEKDAMTSLDDWETAHHAKIMSLVNQNTKT